MRWVHELTADKPRAAPAIIDADGTVVSFGALDSMAEAIAAGLAAHGVRPGDRVMLICENSAHFGAVVLAASRLAAWVSPINARQSADELEAIAAHAEARCIVFTAAASPAAAAHAERFGAVPLGGFGAALPASPVRPAEPEPVPDDPAERVAALMYTTGTTSAPKGVMLTHANLTWNARTSVDLRGMTTQDVVLGVLPGTHIFGFSSAFLASLHAGSAIRFLPRFSPQAVLDAFAEGASVMPAVPQMYTRILEHLERTGAPLRAPRLRYISAGGAPLDPDWKQRTEAAFGLYLNNGYGLTETSPSVAGTRRREWRADTAVGYAVPEVTLSIDAPDAQGVGELLIRGPCVMKGYYRNREATAAVLAPDGTFRSGDLARIDPDGAVHIVGRTKELIIRSGFNVHPPEVEAMLTRHPAVVQSAVVGRPVAGNEEILAFVIASGDTHEDELKDWLRSRLVAYKVPQHIFIVDGFPVAATGKVLKHKLTSHFADRISERDSSRAA